MSTYAWLAITSICFLLLSTNTSAAQSRGGATAKVEALLTSAGLKINPAPKGTGVNESLYLRVRWSAYVTDQLYIKPGDAPVTPGGGLPL